MLERARRRRGKGDDGYEREVTNGGVEEEADEQMSESELADQLAYKYCAGFGSRFASLEV